MRMSNGLVELEDARARVLEHTRLLPAEEVPLADALGRHLAQPVSAPAPVQGFDNSAMDGFAVIAADTAGARPENPVALRVAGESRAGRPAGRRLERGQAMAISTGAMLPEGADAIVRIEAASVEAETVELTAPVRPGADVRRAGEDIAAGEQVLEAGARLGAAEVGVLAAVGAGEPACRRRPRVAVLTTGDELRRPGVALEPGTAYDSNSFTVPALARGAGAEVTSVGWTNDEGGPTRKAIARALKADVAIVCGGVSVGVHDHVRGALAALGAEERFAGVALKPGRPALFATAGETLVFGLPGNPVSAMVTFVLLVRPALIAMQGGAPDAHRIAALLATDYAKPPGRAHALRCSLELSAGGWVASPAPAQGSHVLTSMLGADCLAIVPSAATHVPAGGGVEAELVADALAGAAP
jgi:molybdopterin molybdotransferase